MTWKDKLEIGLKDDAPFRRDNLPAFQLKTGRPDVTNGDAARSPEEPGARAKARADSLVAAPAARSSPRTTTPRTMTRRGNGRPATRAPRKRG